MTDTATHPPRQIANDLIERISVETGISTGDILSHRIVPEFVAARKRAFNELYDAGWSVTLIANILGFHRDTVTRQLDRKQVSVDAVDLNAAANELDPPAHICGPLTSGNRKACSDRRKWINSVPQSYTARQVARALGITAEQLTHLVPGRFTIAARAEMGISDVSLPPLPFEIERCDRSHTAPRSGIISVERPTRRARAAIAAIREMHAEMTQEAGT